MGGRGSGRHASYGVFVDKCEDCKSIDLSILRKRGILTIGNCGEISWRRRGQKFASVRYILEPNGLRLVYRACPYEGAWQDVNELIHFVETPTNFGGQRRWLLCPSCGNRCRIVFGGTHFRCRKCHGLRYESQYEDPICRVSSQRHKLRERLGQLSSLEDPFPPKPKRMRWKTYEKLKERDSELGQRWNAEVRDWLQRTDPRR